MRAWPPARSRGPLAFGVPWLPLAFVAAVLLAPGALGTATSPPRTLGPPAPASAIHPALSLPNPRNYSALGDSITPAYDADGSFDLATEGPQPWYSYAVGNNSEVFSLYQRLLRLYPNTTGERLEEHLLAVPGDKASDMIWQSVRAVQNRSGLVSVLIGGNDVCDGTVGNPTPTPVWNFSASLNHTLRILRQGLGSGVVITLGNVVNVTHLYTLFGGNEQAQLVWQNTCPALLTTSGRATMAYMIRAYNHMESIIARSSQVIDGTNVANNVTIFDIANYSFSVDDVNHLDYFHPSPSGQANLASQWWSALPYSTMSPLFTAPPALPSSLPVATPLAVAVGVRDPVPPVVQVTYKETGALFWSTVPLSLLAGEEWNGTFGATLPFNATDVAGVLQLYFTAADPDGYTAVLPVGVGTEGVYEVGLTTPGATPSSPLASVTLEVGTSSLQPGWSTTLRALAVAENGGAETAGVAYAWSLSPSDLGQVIPEGNGSEALFVAAGAAGSATITVTASSGVVVRSDNSTLQVTVPSPSTNVPPATPGPSPAAAGAPLLNLELLLLVLPVAFLVSMAALGRWSRPKTPSPAGAPSAPAAPPEEGSSSEPSPKDPP